MESLSKVKFENDQLNNTVLSKVVRAGRRTYFFDVRSTRGQEYFLTITESRKINEEGGYQRMEKQKLILYKEDFTKFSESLTELIDYMETHNNTGVVASAEE